MSYRVIQTVRIPHAVEHERERFSVLSGIKIHRATYDPLWYVAQPMGKNKIQDIVPEMARNAGITAKLTNHSLRHMTCQNLLSSGISPTVVIQLTGHKNVNSLQNYIVADDK